MPERGQRAEHSIVFQMIQHQIHLGVGHVQADTKHNKYPGKIDEADHQKYFVCHIQAHLAAPDWLFFLPLIFLVMLMAMYRELFRRRESQTNMFTLDIHHVDHYLFTEFERLAWLATKQQLFHSLPGLTKTHEKTILSSNCTLKFFRGALH
ncbi:MAG: hypothetical protein AAAB21_27885 [Pseudomonas chlororaphis]